MNVVVLGASGILGQHLRLSVPTGVDVRWYRQESDLLHAAFQYRSNVDIDEYIANADAIINCAGQSNVDVVEDGNHSPVNVELAGALAGACNRNNCHYVHVSSNAAVDPVNEYGRQKLAAEHLAQQADKWTIARPTFLLGIRPLPHVGRRNPAEEMMAGGKQKQVCNRWFSAAFATESSKLIWDLATSPPKHKVIHIGWPVRFSRYDIARVFSKYSGADVEATEHESFGGLAPRPHDVSYSRDSLYGCIFSTFDEGVMDCALRWKERANPMVSIGERAREIAIFLGLSEEDAARRLSVGFPALHNQVRMSWNRANPQTEAEILHWYRTSTDYIWELSAYHADSDYGYAGLCHSMLQRLSVIQPRRILCLGDGIGDLTWYLRINGLDAVFHDLSDSKTAAFAQFVYWKRTGENLPCILTDSFTPDIAGRWDCILAIDFLEHVPNVRQWVRAIRQSLNPGGYFVAQNAFGIGSGKHGSIPCHLSINDQFEKTWDDVLKQEGFLQESPQWYKKAI